MSITLPFTRCNLPPTSGRASKSNLPTVTPYYPASATVTQTFWLWLTQSFFWRLILRNYLYSSFFLSFTHTFDRHTLLGIEIKLLFNIPSPIWLCTLRYRPFRHAMILTFFPYQAQGTLEEIQAVQCEFCFQSISGDVLINVLSLLNCQIEHGLTRPSKRPLDGFRTSPIDTHETLE